MGVRAWRRCDASLELRQARVRVGRGRSRGRLTLITDRTATAARQLAQWYRRRWEIETNFRHLKRTLNLEFFACRTVAGVQRELRLRQIAYNLVRRIMLRAGRRLNVPGRRIGFAHATQALLYASPATALRLLSPVLARTRTRTTRPRQLKYRGKNYRQLTKRPVPRRRIT